MKRMRLRKTGRSAKLTVLLLAVLGVVIIGAGGGYAGYSYYGPAPQYGPQAEFNAYHYEQQPAYPGYPAPYSYADGHPGRGHYGGTRYGPPGRYRPEPARHSYYPQQPAPSNNVQHHQNTATVNTNVKVSNTALVDVAGQEGADGDCGCSYGYGPGVDIAITQDASVAVTINQS